MRTKAFLRPMTSLPQMGLAAPARRSKSTYVVSHGSAWRPSFTNDCPGQSDDRDSALGDSQSSYVGTSINLSLQAALIVARYTMSATSSVFNFRYENGRRYHAYAEGKYPVPNDEVRTDPTLLELVPRLTNRHASG